MKLRIRTWKPAEIHLSHQLTVFVHQKQERGGSTWFSIQDVLESLAMSDPLYREADELFKRHGEFFFRFTEF